jgi:hypothetical protein
MKQNRWALFCGKNNLGGTSDFFCSIVYSTVRRTLSIQHEFGRPSYRKNSSVSPNKREWKPNAFLRKILCHHGIGN